MKTVNKKLVFLGLALIAVSLLVYRMLQRSATTPAPSAPTITNVQPDSSFNIKAFTFTGNTFTPPPQLDVYASQRTIPSGEFAQNVATLLNLQPSNVPGRWRNDAAGEVLTLSSIDKSMEYLHTVSPGEVLYTDAFVQKSINTGLAFLSKVGYQNTLKPDAQKILYYAQAFELHPATKTTSNVAAIPYTIFINDIPVFFENTTQPPAIFWIDSTQQILKAEFFSAPPSMAKQTTSETRSIADALENMKAGNATVISTQIQGGLYSISDIVSADFKNVTLEYRYTDSSSVFYPYYHFVGTGKTSTGGTLGLDIITPAVK